MNETKYDLRTITDSEKQVLEALSSKSPSPRLQDRVRSIMLSSQGRRTTQILKAVTRKRSTILRWIKAFNRRGTASLACSGATARI